MNDKPDKPTSQKAETCPYCGEPAHAAKCPLVTAFDYYPDGKVKRVEFRARNRDAIVRVGGQASPALIERLASRPQRPADIARAQAGQVPRQRPR